MHVGGETLTVLADLGDPHVMDALAYRAERQLSTSYHLVFRSNWLGAGTGGLAWVFGRRSRGPGLVWVKE